MINEYYGYKYLKIILYIKYQKINLFLQKNDRRLTAFLIRPPEIRSIKEGMHFFVTENIFVPVSILMFIKLIRKKH